MSVSSPRDDLRQALRRVRARWMACTSLTAGARAACAAALTLAAAAYIDAVLRPADLWLMLLGASAVVLALAAASWLFWRGCRVPSDPQVARLIEERCPALEDALVTATSAGERPSPFSDLLYADAARRVRAVDLAIVVERRRLVRAGLAAMGAILLLLTTAVVVRDAAFRAAGSAWMYLNPHRIVIDVTPGDARVVAGQPLRVTARLRGMTSRTSAVLHYAHGGAWRSAPMRATGDAFDFGFDAVTDDFAYRITAATASSRDFTIKALRPPGVARIDVRYTYPAYTGLVPRTERDGGDVYAPVGTTIRLRIHPTKPVVSGAMTMTGGPQRPLRRAADGAFEAEFTVEDDGAYRVALSDSDGVGSPGDTEYFIRLMDDRPPDVQILQPASDRDVTPLEEVPIEARADDDYGLERFDLVYAVRGGREKTVPLAAGRLQTTATGRHLLQIEDLEVKPGDFVTFYARARDVGRGKRSVEARSDIYFLEVKPFEEEFASATSNAQGGGRGDQTMESLAAAQKDIVIATWKLNRRAAAGRSAEDIRSIARAQAELKQRAGRAGAAPSAATPGGGTDETPPMVAAAAAMGRAQQALEAINTATALPHEMEALNQLLKAAAQVRRREVVRQQANSRSGGGGRGRSGQDLSSLFDRELQREQQTNYETRSRGEDESRADRGEDPLKKVRELARRQEDLNRQQRDLARDQAKLSAEELKRRLERLTRDQSDLRRQAEEIAREMSRSQSADGQMRDVSEEMQNATSDLRRNDAGGASARTGRALEKLRDMEQQLRGAQPDERRRATGELQLEAQQIATAQRRIAEEAAQSAGSGRPAPGAGPVSGRDSNGERDRERRIAGEKERLADRVDRLQRGARQLGGAGGDGDRQRLADAARELEREQVARRLRDSASELRRRAGAGTGAAPARGAPRPAAPRQEDVDAERQLARALERVAERIGAGAAGDRTTQKLSDQLNRARDLRERLGAIEQQLERMARGEGNQPRADASNQQGGQPGRSPGREGANGAQGSGGSGGFGNLQAQYARELRQSQELLDQMRRQNPGVNRNMATPEQHEHSLSAPGTEAFKQDFARWDVLRRDVNLALERLQSQISSKLHEQALRDRLNAGPNDRIPEQYRQIIDEYYRTLATGK